MDTTQETPMDFHHYVGFGLLSLAIVFIPALIREYRNDTKRILANLGF